MFRRPLIWCVISLLCFAGAYYFWRLGNRWQAEKKSTAPATNVAQPTLRPGTNTFRSPATSPMFLLTGTVTNAPAPAVAPAANKAFPYRVANTPQSSGQLLRNDRAILLENALIDTTHPLALGIPSELRATGDPGAYIVQSRRPLDDAFRAELTAAGVTIVSYIPNNAYLVRATGAAASRLAALSDAQAVLPYEPYYKLRASLLGKAVRQETLPVDAVLNVLMFADSAAQTAEALRQSGALIVSQEPSPFGTVAQLHPRPDTLVALAKLPGVQTIELAQKRVHANDLSRVRLGVTTDTTSGLTNNYLGLTGSNVLVNVTDSGVDATHPDLLGRVFGYNGTGLTDTVGHGTHVAATIAGSGIMGTTPVNVGGVLASNDFGSVVNADYRGMAPNCRIFSLIADLLTGPLLTDAQLQEVTATTNALISNNSWSYVNDNSYSLAAASYDAAVRDALPGVTGSQPVLFVFAAGNQGNGNNEGTGGNPESINAPATAKNVLAVGSLEAPRHITNSIIANCVTNVVIDTNDMTTNIVVSCDTNAPFAGLTDSDRQVAFFSSRGNVGIGVEGDFGRIKPDVVAPGTFIVSARSAQWDTNAYFSGYEHNYSLFTGVTLATNDSFVNLAFLPENTVGFTITIRTNQAIPQPFPQLPILVNPNDIPVAPANVVGSNSVSIPPALPLTPLGQGWFYSIINSTTQDVKFDLVVDVITTNDTGGTTIILSNLDSQIGPFYRFESGTSMSAAEASGVLALMQEFFQSNFQRTNSPALMKALLINGARSAGPLYDFEVQNSIDYQGWGLIHLPNCLPSTNGLTGAVQNMIAALTHSGPASMEVYEQDSTNALATGQSVTRTVHVSPGGINLPLRVTLVWTDPPGNPVAGVKLVNDLDLIVTNLETGDVYFGNDIPTGSNFTFPWDTNSAPNIDSVNNIENIYIPSTLGSNYSITVSARRVNVNAVTSHANNVVQDYALVMSAGDGQVPDALQVVSETYSNAPGWEVTYPPNTFTNTPGVAGSLLFHQHVGANTPLLGTTNGMTNQWHFYVIFNTNSENKTFTNAAFVTFFPPTLAVPRIGTRETDPDNATRVEADIDLYVSTNPNLTNLDATVLASSIKSRTRGGTEVVAISNAENGVAYYVGVKSEDYMAAEYAFLAIFSEQPFGSKDENGNLILRGLPVPATIPDGSPANPGAALVFGIATESLTVRRVVVTNTITHNNMGDLLGDLIHDQKVVALNNHRSAPNPPVPPGPYTFVYEDNGQDQLRHTDGPGSLRDFIGSEAIGLWLLTMIDDSISQTGSVNALSVKLEPQLTNLNSIILEIPANGFVYDFVDVPPGTTNLEICAENISASPGALPLELYVKYGDFPTRTDYDYFSLIGTNLGGTCIDINADSIPPLALGRYFIGVYNPNTASQTVRLIIRLGVDVASIQPISFASTNGTPIIDDAVTTASLFNSNHANVASVEVSLRVDHPRISDLAFTLISPSGTRVLLMENRGRTNDAGLGSTLSITNFIPVTSNGGYQAQTNTLDTGVTAGTVTIDYQFFGIPDRMTVYYDNTRLFDSGYISGAGQFNIKYGPGNSTQVIIVMNEGGNTNNPTTQWNYTASSIQNIYNYVTFTEDTNKAPVPIKFATPPFTAPAASIDTVISTFDAETAGTKLAPTNVDGWAVTTNKVTVVNDPVLVNAGPNSLGVRDGEMSRLLPTATGRKYGLGYGFRKAPSFVYDVAKDFSTNSNPNGPWSYGYSGTLGGGFSLDLEAGNLGGVDFWRTNIALGTPGVYHNPTAAALTNGTVVLDPGQLEFHPGPNGEFSVIRFTVPSNGVYHVYGAFAGADVVGTTTDVHILTNNVQIFSGIVNGFGVLAGPPFDLTLSLATNDVIDFAVGRGLNNDYNFDSTALAAFIGPAIVTDVGARVTIPGVATNTIFGTTNWMTNSIFFTAAVTNTPLSVASPGGESGVMVDSFVLREDVGSLYFFPEESLDAFKGEPAFGEWKLEIWDSRTGALINDALVSWRLDFIYQNGQIFRGVFPPIITLTNGIPYTNQNCNPFPATDYYRYVVSTNAARAQFEVNNPSGDVTLIAKKNLPLPDLSTWDYRSANRFTNDELIVVLTNSTPVPLTPGSWYLGVINMTAGCVNYSIKATEWPVTGRPIIITHVDVSTNGFCITWQSLTNVHYYIEGTPSLSPITWVTASPTITATNSLTTYCIPLPSPLHFFRVVEGIAVNPYSPPPILSITFTNGGNLLTWTGPLDARYLVQWNSVLIPPPPWNTFTNIVTTTNGLFSFFDNGSQTPGGLTSPRFYRLLQLP